MPKLPVYERQVELNGPVQTRRASGDDFGAGIGEGMQQLGATVGRVNDVIYKRKEQNDVSNINAQVAQTHDEYTKRYQEELQKGTLDTDKFMEDFQTHLDKAGEGIETRAGNLHYRAASAELKSHFLVTAASGQSQLAGKKAVENYTTTLNSSSSALINDPSSFDLAMKLQTTGLDNLVATGGLPAEAATKLKSQSATELAKSAVRGWNNLNPQLAKDQLNSGKFDQYFDGDVKKQLLGEVTMAENAKLIESERLKRAHEEIVKQQQTVTQNSFLEKMNKNEVTADDVLKSNLDPFGSGSKEQFLNMLKAHNSAENKIKTDPGVMIDTWDRIHLPDDDPRKIRDENELNDKLGRGLTLENINALRGEISGKKTQEGNIESELKKGLTEIAKGKLTKSNAMTGLRDPIGDENYQRWLGGFLQDYNKKRKEGKTAEQMLNPDSPDYLGKSINQYMRSQKQILQDQIKGMKGPSASAAPTPEPRKPGESASDYLKRMGK